MDENRIKKVFSDEAFVKSLLEKENAADVQAALKEKNLEFSLDEINEIRKKIIEMSSSDSELSLDQLQEVAGGSISAATVIGVAGLVIGVGSLIAVGGGIAIGAAATITRGRW